MRRRWGPVPEDPEFSPEAGGWRPLREPRSPVVFSVLSLPPGCLAAAVLLYLAAVLEPSGEVQVRLDRTSLVALLPLIPLHELLHALCFPEPLRSPRVILGFWPRAFLFYAHYTGELSRDRFLWVLICPFLTFSAAALLLAAADPGRQELWLGLGAAHALASSGDLLGFLRVGLQVPRAARVRNRGWLTYWRPEGGPA